MPLEYEQIRRSLQQNIINVKIKMERVQEIQESGRVATTEDIEFLDAPLAALDNQEISLMMQSKSNRRQEKGESSYQPFLIDDKNQDNFNSFLAGLPRGQPFHYDVILKNGAHCTPLQIHSNGSEMRMFFLDAAGDPINQKAKEDVENALGIIAYENLEIGTQKDNSSCSIYSIQDLASMSKLSQNDLTISLSQEKLEKDKQLSRLHPKFIKNSQTMSLIDKYKKLSSTDSLMLSQDKALDKYIKDYSITIEIADEVTGATKQKAKNYAILAKRYKYLELALKTFDVAYGDGDAIGKTKLERILQDRQGANILEVTRSALTLEQKTLVKGVYNSKQIDLILNYGVGKENIPCFNSSKMTDKAIAFITKGVNPMNVNDAQKQVMNDRIDKIRELQSFVQLSAVLDYGLDPKEVNEASCFRVLDVNAKYYSKHDRNRDNEALERIDSAYHKSFLNPWGAKSLFEKIKKCQDQQDIILLLDYGIDSKEIYDSDVKEELLKRIKFISNDSSVTEESLDIIDDNLFDRTTNFVKVELLKLVGTIYNNVLGIEKNSNKVAADLFNQVKKLQTKEQIIAVLDYGLNVSEVSQAKIFNEETLKYIKTAFDQKGTLEEKKKFAELAFVEIKDLNHDNKLYLVNHGVDPVLAKSATFLTNEYSDRENEASKKFIAKWYAIAGEKGANVAFKSLDQIKRGGGTNYVYLSIDDVQSLPKTADKLEQYFVKTNPQIAQTWREVLVKLPKQELPQLSTKAQETQAQGSTKTLLKIINMAVDKDKEGSQVDARDENIKVGKLPLSTRVSHEGEVSKIVAPLSVKSKNTSIQIPKARGC